MDSSTAKRGDQKKAHWPVSRPMGSSAKLECDAFVAAEIIYLANTLTRVFVYFVALQNPDQQRRGADYRSNGKLLHLIPQ